MKICTTCGKEWPDEYRLCPADGSSLPSSAAGGDLIDSIIADRYHISKKLGEGGMGAVYLGEHVKMGQKAAIKVITRTLASDPAAIARFTREARNAAQIKHPNVCMIHDFGETPDGLIYMAMEYIEGESLAELLKREGRLGLERAANIIMQCCDALQAAHDLDIVHRDIKPENIMITKGRGGKDIVKVVDFGIAKAVAGESGQTVTQTGFIVGTPDYMSPDQVSGEVLDGRSDIYSLAVVFFRMVTGDLPFRADTPHDALLQKLAAEPRKLQDTLPQAGFPKDLQEVLDRALAQRRENRYGTSIEFGQAVVATTRGRRDSLPPTIAASAGAAETRPLHTPEPLIPPTEMAPAPPGARTPETPQPAPSPARKGKGKRVAAIFAGLVLVGAAAGAGILTFTGGSGDGSAVADDSTKTNGDKPDSVGTVAISGLPDGGTILAAGDTVETPFELPAGRHDIEFRAPGFVNKTVRIEVVAGERQTVVWAAQPVAETRTPTRAAQRTQPQPTRTNTARAPARSIAVGQTRTGTLTTGDPLVRDRHAQTWTMRVPAGQQVDITLRSTDFDAYLYLEGPGISQALENDDGAGNLNSRISTRLSGGTYTITASALVAGATGAYTLAVTAPANLAALETGGRRLAVGETVSGTLTESGPTYEGRSVQAWALQGTRGQQMDIVMRARAFDTYLYLAGPGLSEPLSDDDGADGTNSRIRVTFPQSGNYTVIASQYAGGGTGAYTLSAARPGTERFATGGRTIALGRTGNGTLTAGGETFQGRPIQAWALRGTRGARLEITMRSTAFDTYLFLVGPGLDDPLRNDDGADGSNSRIAVTLPQSGTYYVLASAYGSSMSGAYTLSVATPPSLADLPTDGRMLSAGTSVGGTLTTSNPTFEGRYVQVFEMRASAGTRVQISMQSDEFDTYLYLTGPGIATPLTDDDGGEGTSSRLSATLSAGGVYRVVAAGYNSSALGAFRLSVGRQ